MSAMKAGSYRGQHAESELLFVHRVLDGISVVIKNQVHTVFWRIPVQGRMVILHHISHHIKILSELFC